MAFDRGAWGAWHKPGQAMAEEVDIAVVGGGAAGFFGALAAAEAAPGCRIVILEKARGVLAKVRISGGGRCNVTHACYEPAELVRHYPRGRRELLGPFHAFGPRETVAWFAERGVRLKTEADGRMFPTTDRSASVIDALTRAAQAAGVAVRTREGLCGLAPVAGGFALELGGGRRLRARRVLLATGGLKPGPLMGLLEGLGHRIAPLAPSLFTFNAEDARIAGLAGVSVDPVATAVPQARKLSSGGPLLITHWGLSGPAVLKLSAWGARELHGLGYRFGCRVNWLPGHTAAGAGEALRGEKAGQARRRVRGAACFGLPGRLWDRLGEAAGIPPERTWSHLTRGELDALAGQLTASEFAVDGKSTNKEEFVTCGGVRLKEVAFRTLESRLVPGLHFAGEVLDIDAVTGGFNFQAAWTTGRLAGLAMAASLGS